MKWLIDALSVDPASYEAEISGLLLNYHSISSAAEVVISLEGSKDRSASKSAVLFTSSSRLSQLVTSSPLSLPWLFEEIHRSTTLKVNSSFFLPFG